MAEPGTLPQQGWPIMVTDPISGTVKFLSQAAFDSLNETFTTFAAYVVNTARAAGRAVQIVCTVAGNVSIEMAGGGTNIIPVAVGLTILPFAATKINATGTTATATYGALS